MSDSPNRIALVVAAAVVSGGIAAAFAGAFPGRVSTPTRVSGAVAVNQSTSDFSLPSAALATPAATPAGTAAAASTQSASRDNASSNEPVFRIQPAAPSGGGGGSADVSQLPGPAQKAVGDQPQQPSQPDQPPGPQSP